jgi:hypothetical protein
MSGGTAALTSLRSGFPRPTSARVGYALRGSGCAFALAGFAMLAVIATNQIDWSADRLGIKIINANLGFSWSHDLDKLILASSVVAALGGALRPGRHQRLWATTAFILGLFLIDELSTLHAEIGGLHFGVGKLMYAPILLVLVICVWLLAAATKERFVVAVGVLVLSVCFGMHVVGMRILRHLFGYLSSPYQLGVGIKEGSECAGFLLVVPALWRLSWKNAAPSPCSADRASSGPPGPLPPGLSSQKIDLGPDRRASEE